MAQDAILFTMITYMPVVNSSYAYAIQTKDDELFNVASNTEDVQAIKYGNKIAACFYNKDIKSFEYGSKTYELTNDFVDGEGAFQVFEVK